MKVQGSKTCLSWAFFFKGRFLEVCWPWLSLFLEFFKNSFRLNFEKHDKIMKKNTFELCRAYKNSLWDIELKFLVTDQWKNLPRASIFLSWSSMDLNDKNVHHNFSKYGSLPMYLKYEKDFGCLKMWNL